MAASRLERLAAEVRSAGTVTPFYLYDLEGSVARYESMIRAWSAVFDGAVDIAYSYKTNRLRALTTALQSHGAKAEVVCGAEFQWALDDGYPADHIVFNGPYKSPAELSRAIALGARVQIDHLGEVTSIVGSIRPNGARRAALSARLALPHASAGVSRFGLLPEEFDKARRMLVQHGLDFSGVHVHSGVPCATPDLFARNAAYAAPALRLLQRRNDRVVLDLGGGFPSSVSAKGRRIPDDEEYAQVVRDRLLDTGVEVERLQIVLEPGRSLTDDFGVLACEVVATKRRGDTTLLVVNASRNLARSAASACPPRILSNEPPTATYEVVGWNCYESDLLGSDVAGPARVQDGAVVTVRGVGGYDFTTAPSWIRPLPAVLVWTGARTESVRAPQSLSDARRGAVSRGISTAPMSVSLEG